MPTSKTLKNLCYIGVGEPEDVPFTYAQILKDELGYGGTLIAFVPGPKSDLMEFIRSRSETVFVIIGSAEIAMKKYMVCYKFMEAFQVVSKEGVRLLLDFEVKHQREKSDAPPTPPVLSTPSSPMSRISSIYMSRPTTPPRTPAESPW